MAATTKFRHFYFVVWYLRIKRLKYVYRLYNTILLDPMHVCETVFSHLSDRDAVWIKVRSRLQTPAKLLYRYIGWYQRWPTLVHLEDQI
jgi:hypothetical protein